MAQVREADLRRELVAQGFRIEDNKAHDGFAVYAPNRPSDVEGTSVKASGIVQVHSNSIGSENGKMGTVLSELSKIGFDPQALVIGRKAVKPVKAVPRQPEPKPKAQPEPETPPVRRYSIQEAAAYLTAHGRPITGSGIRQAILAGKLPATKDSTKRTSPYLITEDALIAYQPGRGRPSKKASRVVTKHLDTPAGNFSESVAALKKAQAKVVAAMDELIPALEAVAAQAGGFLSEHADMKREKKEIERDIERMIGRLR